MLKYILILLALISVVSASAQERTNPFEIKGRSADTLKNVIPVIDSIPNDVQDSNTPVQATNEISKESNAKSSKNPFDVNHVPLRKKDVRAKTNTNKLNETPTNITPKTTTNISYIFWLLLASLLLLVITVTNSPAILSKVSKSIFNENILKLEQRNNNMLSFDYILLYIIFIANVGIFTFLLLRKVVNVDLSFSSLLLISGVALAIYLVKHMSIFLVGRIFDFSKEGDLYNFTIEIFNLFIGVILIPVNAFIAYGPEESAKPTLLICIGVLSILLIIRYLRGLTISAPYFFNNIIPIFLYLCAMEIAPLLIFVKLVQGYF